MQRTKSPRAWMWMCLAVVSCAVAAVSAHAAEPEKPAPKSPFKYVWGTAYHIPSEYTTDESGYFALNEGIDGKMYVGTAAYGLNAYLIEFDPKTEKMRCVIDSNKVIGVPTPQKPTYAAQSKIHTRNFTGPSGTVYVGTKQGYRRGPEDTADYPGGYVITYDPKTGTSKNLGMPYPTQGVIDTVADESRGLIYVVTCEDQHWMVYDMKTGKYTEPDPSIRLVCYATTLIEPSGRASAITADGRLARYDPATGKASVQDLVIDGAAPAPFATVIPGSGSLEVEGLLAVTAGLEAMTKIVGEKNVTQRRINDAHVTLSVHGDVAKTKAAVAAGKAAAEKVGKVVASSNGETPPTWQLAADGKTAYLIVMSRANLYQIDLSVPSTGAARAKDLGAMTQGEAPDSRCSVSIAPDGRVYVLIRENNKSGFGAGYLHYLHRYDPKKNAMESLGVIAVKNKDFFNWEWAKTADNGKPKPWTHGYHTLPDGTMTPLHAHMATVVAHDGSIYITILYPYTLLRIAPIP